MKKFFVCGYLLVCAVLLGAGCSGFGKEDRCTGMIPAGYTCCGNQVLPDYRCCNTVPVGPGQICCAGLRVADLKTEICCHGEVYPRESVECCDRTPSPVGTCSAPKKPGI